MRNGGYWLEEKLALSQRDLKHWLAYDHITGVFRWRRKGSRKLAVGDIAGCKSVALKKTYWVIGLAGFSYRAHHGEGAGAYVRVWNHKKT